MKWLIDLFKNRIESYLGKYFLAFAICVILFWYGKIDLETFKWALTAYFGGGAVSSFAKK